MGDEAADARNYPLAESFYRQAYLLDSSDFDLTVKYAEASRQIKDYRTALHLYEKAWYKDEGKLFPEGLFWIAMIEKQLGRYEEAGQHFRKYAKKFKKNRSLRDRAEQEAGACDWVLGWKPLTDTLALAEVTGNIRTAESEIAPVLVDSMLFFSRHLPEEAGTGTRWVLMQAQWNGGEATQSKLLRGGPEHYANLSIGRGDEVFFAKCPVGMPCELWTGQLVNGALTNERKVNDINDSEASSTQPHYAVISGWSICFFHPTEPMAKAVPISGTVGARMNHGPNP
jgi:tetratricopeptide (TPR) repeat protein